MALLEELTFTGQLGEFSAYRMRGCKKIVIRKKGGATKDQIRNSPSFEVPRKYMTEFGGCSRMGKHVRLAMIQLRGLADYNTSGPINKIMKVIQKQDKNGDLGRRSILLSKYPSLLEGFSLNEGSTIDSIIRNPLAWSLDRETGTARIAIPELVRGINFFPQNRHALFRVEATLGIAPDFLFNGISGKYEPPAWYTAETPAQYAYTPWAPALEGSEGATLELEMGKLPPDDSYSLVLSIGISFASLSEGGSIKQVKRAGAAKILAIRGGSVSNIPEPLDIDTAPVAEFVPEQPRGNPRSKKSAAPQSAVTQQNVRYTYTTRQTAGSTEPAATHVYTYTFTTGSQPDAEKVKESSIDVPQSGKKQKASRRAGVLRNDCKKEVSWTSGVESLGLWRYD